MASFTVNQRKYRAHGQSFHISIWHVALNGIVDEEYVERVRSRYEEVLTRIFVVITMI